MLAYYGYTISPNQLETGEGFLICRNVPVARTGIQEYLGREIGLIGAAADQVVSVWRSPEEVFSDAALASFEGKPATNDHPPDLIGPDDVAVYEKGHAQNIRRGKGEWADYVLADLHIHDRELIEAIQSGKREISCGYTCEYVENADGTYSQKNIRGNHIAVVDRGRAGKRAAILDSDRAKQEARRPERKAMKKNGLFFKLFGQAVKDKSPEEIEQLAMDAADAFDEEARTSAGEGEKKEETADEAGKEKPPGVIRDEEAILDDLAQKVLAKLEAKKEEKKSADPLDAAIARLSGDSAGEAASESKAEEKEDKTSQDEEASRVVPAEESDKGCGMDRALAVGILKAMRPAVAAIKDEAQRRAVSDALLNCVAVQDGKSDITAILQASQNNAKKAAGSGAKSMDNDAIQALYDNMNPHRRKESKE